MTYSVRSAKPHDMTQILEMSEGFFQESNNSRSVTFSKENLRKTLTEQWSNPQFRTIIVQKDGKMAGYAHVDCQTAFTNEPIGEVYQFYIDPPHRGTVASRLLTAACDGQFSEWKCPISYTECGSGIDKEKNNKLFFNLWSKFGYCFLGTALFKEHK